MYKPVKVQSRVRPSQRAFVCTLIKKLNQVALRNRIIQRNLKSVSPLDKRFRSSQVSECKQSDFSCSTDSLNVGHAANQQENSFQQQQWDEMFESAFEAIHDETFVDFFNEK